MPAFGAISRADFIKNLRQLGFDGPSGGTRHELMRRGDTTVRIPNPHRSSISKDLLARLLVQARISRAEWERI